jgi:hypothetical protein
MNVGDIRVDRQEIKLVRNGKCVDGITDRGIAYSGILILLLEINLLSYQEQPP